MKTTNVIVLPYDRVWKSAFEEIKKEIEGAIGDLIVGIEHVGSTSVEGLSAKPCIDIDVVIKDYSVFEAVVSRLDMIGYIHEGNLGIKDREHLSTQINLTCKSIIYMCAPSILRNSTAMLHSEII